MQGNVQKYELVDQVKNSVNQLLKNWEMLQEEEWGGDTRNTAVVGTAGMW